MKNLLSFTFVLFSVIYSTAQDLLLSEDFDYPVGANLNQYNWKPLTASSDNPIKVTQGLTQANFSSSGGAAYLKMAGQDVIRSFTKTSEGQIFIAFQLNVKKTINQSTDLQNLYPYDSETKTNNYFMFLSSAQEPTKPLLKFTLTKTFAAGSIEYLVVRDASDKIIAMFGSNNNSTYDIVFSYHLSGQNEGIAFVHSNTIKPFYFSKPVSKLKIPNLSNIVLSQSDPSVGSEAIIDRIRIGKTYTSVMPCLDKSLLYDDKTSPEIVLKTCANQEVKQDINAELTGVFSRSLRPITDLEVTVPVGFQPDVIPDYIYTAGKPVIASKNKLTAYQLDLPHSYGATFGGSNIVKLSLVGNSVKITPEGKYIAGDPGVFEGEIHFTPVSGYCKKEVWKIKGIIEDCSKNADLLLSEDFDYKKGETLTQNNWQALGTSTTNPIKVVDGLTKTGYSASGGAAYLNKTGQDVRRAFPTINENKIELSFQINLKDLQKVGWYGANCTQLNASDFPSSNYFMFLSSKTNPQNAQLRFSLISTWCGGPDAYLIVRGAQIFPLAIAVISPSNLYLAQKEVQSFKFEYYLTGENAGRAFLNGVQNQLNPSAILRNNLLIPDLSYITLSQSSPTMGSELIIDRIRISKPQNGLLHNKSESSSFNATIFPNTTDGKIDLLINDQTPEGDFDVQLSDNQGNSLFQNTGNWESLKPNIEQILSKNKSGQYFFTVKQGNESKTIRVFRQE